MTVSLNRATGTVEIEEINVGNARFTSYTKELKELKARQLELVKDVQNARAEFLQALFDVDQADKADVEAVEAKEEELAEITESKEGVLDAKELLAIVKAEKELAEEIEAIKHVNVKIAENRTDIYEEKGAAVFAALEAYDKALTDLLQEYEETKNKRTADVYDKEMQAFRNEHRHAGRQTFLTLKSRIQPTWSNYMDEVRFGIRDWRGHSLRSYMNM